MNIYVLCEYRVSEESHWTRRLLTISPKELLKPRLAKCCFIGCVDSKIPVSVNIQRRNTRRCVRMEKKWGHTMAQHHIIQWYCYRCVQMKKLLYLSSSVCIYATVNHISQSSDLKNRFVELKSGLISSPDGKR